MEVEELFFEIIDGENFVRVFPTAYSYLDADNYWDKNWLKLKIEIKANAFSGTYNAEMMTTNFAPFRDMLAYLYNNLSGEARFEDMEHYLGIHLKGDGLGHFEADITACANPGYKEVQLRFHLSFDQTQIPLMLRQLDAITIQFPVK